MSKAEELKKRFGGQESIGEYDQIIREIERIGHLCKNLIWHTKLSSDTLKKLKKEGFSVEFENNCYFISGW